MSAVRPCAPSLRPSRRWLAHLVLLGALLLSSRMACGAEPQMVREYELKAAFVYNFTKFIEWPVQSFSDTNAPLVIGVLGDGPFAAQLTEIVRDRKVNGRAIVVKSVWTPEQVSSTQLLFVSAAETRQFAQVSAHLGDQPVLTVGESASFAQGGGMINFVLADGKVRFEINIGSAGRAGLKISAQLLKLASAVRQGS